MSGFVKFLEDQKQRMLQLDGASEASSWLTEKEQKGQHFSFVNEQTGEKMGMMNILYGNTIAWVNSLVRKTGRFSINEKGNLVPLQEDTVSTAISTFTTALLPAVRRMYQNLFAMELVSVQPLNGPSGYLYYLDHLYSSTYADAKDTITAEDRLDLKHPIDYAASSEKGTIRKIQFQLKSKLISTVSQKLEADWTIESEQDLRSQWKLDLEAELIPELTNECVRETDRRIIEALYAGAAHNVNWNKNGYLGTAADTASDAALAYRKTLYQDAIVTANAYILTNKYVNAQWMIMNPDTFIYLQRLEQFRLDPTMVVGMQSGMGVQYAGTLANMFKVYIAPWFPANKILLGMKGDNWKYATGYYAPYIPLFVSDKYIISDDFTQFARGTMSRYAYGIIPEAYTASTTNNGLVTISITSS